MKTLIWSCLSCTTCALRYAKNLIGLWIRRGPDMIDRDVKELFIGFAAIAIFAIAIVYFRQ